MKYAVLFLCFILLGSSFASNVKITNNCNRQLKVVMRKNNVAATTSVTLAAKGTHTWSGLAGGINIRESDANTGITQAEFNFNDWVNHDFYDISCIDGYNTAMRIIPAANNEKAPTVTCTSRTCADAYQFPADNSKNHGIANTGGTFQLIFCP